MLFAIEIPGRVSIEISSRSAGHVRFVELSLAIVCVGLWSGRRIASSKVTIATATNL